MLIEIIVTSIIRMIVNILAPKGVEYLENATEEAKKNTKVFLNEHVPTRWLGEPLEEIVDQVFPLVSDIVIDHIKNTTKDIHLTSLTNHVVDCVGEECVAKVKEKLYMC